LSVVPTLPVLPELPVDEPVDVEEPVEVEPVVEVDVDDVPERLAWVSAQATAATAAEPSTPAAASPTVAVTTRRSPCSRIGM
jgi:hypothetical protein